MNELNRASSVSDRNLLFGMLAWQSGVINEDDLLAALKRWTFEKSRTLSSILSETKRLSPDQVRLLNEMVDAQLRLFQDNAPQALQAISGGIEVSRRLCRELNDRDLDESLGFIENPMTASMTVSSADQFSESIEASTRYRRTFLHAEGGLGEVYSAKDAVFDREVALKQILPKYADDKNARDRFLIEAEVTGSLEHPGIVPVYGLGRDSTGRPFYAMKFVRGQTLGNAIIVFHSPSAISSGLPKQAITQGAASGGYSVSAADYVGREFRNLLTRFVAVCHAVAYAHSRGILHRDLKPSNIMFGDYGETLVVDWGLAKRMGERDQLGASQDGSQSPSVETGRTLTTAGQAVGTLIYMSPEQTEGDPALLCNASDVYSLGATLYHLLTGKAPFSETREGLLHRVRAGRFLHPLKVNSSIPKPLAAICLKAMSTRIADRYQSAQDLAADLERYLADEPVTAWIAPMTERIQRWIRMHRTLASVVASAAFVLLVSVSISAVLLSERNKDLVVARNQAQINETAARKQGEISLQILRSVIQDLQEGLNTTAGGTAVRQRLLNTSLKHLEQLSGEFISQATVDAGTLEAMNQIGDTVLILGGTAADRQENGGLDGPRLDDDVDDSAVKLAGRFYERAFQIAETLLAASPRDAVIQRVFSVCLIRRGDLLARQGDLTNAMEQYEQAYEIRQQLSKDNPEDNAAERDLSVVLNRIGDLQIHLNQSEKEIESFRKSSNIRESLSKRLSGDQGSAYDVAVSYGRLGEAMLIQERLDDALEMLQKKLNYDLDRYKLDNANVEAARNLAASHVSVGDVHRRKGSIDSAYSCYQEAVSIREGLYNNDRSDRRLARDLSTAYERMALSLERRERFTEALEHYQRMLEIKQRLANDDAGDVVAGREFALSLSHVSDILMELNRLDESQVYAEQSLAEFRKLVEKSPENMQFQGDLADACLGLGKVFEEQRKFKDAGPLMHESIEIYRQKLGAQNDTHSPFSQKYTVALNRLGRMLMNQKQHEEALKYFDESLQIRRERLKESDKDPERMIDLSFSLLYAGEVLEATGKADEAIKHYEDVVSYRLQASRLMPEDLSRQRDLLKAYDVLGELYLKQGRPQIAQKQYQEAINQHRLKFGAIAENASEMEFRSNLLEQLGLCCEATGDLETAEVSYREMRELKAKVYAADQSDHDAEFEWSTAINRVGDVCFKRDQFSEARAAYGESLEIRRRLALKNRGNGAFQFGLLVSFSKLHRVQEKQNELAAAIKSLEEGAEVAQQMLDQKQMPDDAQRSLEQFRRSIIRLQRKQLATGDWEQLLMQPSEELPSLLVVRGTAFCDAGRYVDAAAAAAKISELEVSTPKQLRDAAEIFCRCVSGLSESTDSSPPVERIQLQEGWKKDAVACLSKSIERGLMDVDLLEDDQDFSVIKDMTEFRQLLSK